MADLYFRVSPNIILGSYSSTRLGQLVNEYGSRFMVVMDPILGDYGISKKITQTLDDRKVNYFVFDDIPSAPDSSVIKQALNLAREGHVHGVIACGGTKAMNVGRVVAALCNASNDLYAFVDGAVPVCAPLPLICLPTTMRDMFLFADRAPIVDARSRQLKLMKVQPSLNRLTVFDPNLSVSLTENQVASISLHVLCMALESYISQKSNFFSDMIAEKAIELASSAMDGSPTLTTATPPELFLAQSGCMASLAAGVSSTGAGSLLSWTINARYKVARGITAAIMLPHIIEDAAKYKCDKIAKAARIFRVATETTSDEAAASAFAENVRNRIAMANLPARLKELSVSMEQLALAAEDAGDLELINAMPYSTTTDDLFDLIKKAF